jgi:hypothetical protein
MPGAEWKVEDRALLDTTLSDGIDFRQNKPAWALNQVEGTIRSSILQDPRPYSAVAWSPVEQRRDATDFPGL